MSIRNQRDFEKLRAIGRIVRLALDRTAAAVKPGITTRELDQIGARVLAEHGAESAPPKIYGFPGALCISVNDEAIHGILDTMYAKTPYTTLQRAMHIHPTVSELIPTMLGELKPIEPKSA